MAAPLVTRRAFILAKIESTYNTDPTPVVGTDAVLVENIALTLNSDFFKQQGVSTLLGRFAPGVYGGGLAQITFDVLLRGSGAAGTAPDYGPLLIACRMDETIVVSTSVTYAPDTAALGSCTIYFNEDGKLYKLTGCRGTFTLTANAGEPIRLSFTMTGHYAFSDTAQSAVTYDTTVPTSFKSAGFTVDSYGAVIQSLTLDMGNTVSTPKDANAADGYGEITIIDGAPTGTFNPEQVAAATYDFLTKFRSGATYSATTGALGSAGNQGQITMAKLQYTGWGHADRDGIRALDMPFDLLDSSGDDAFSIILT